jgi:Bacteriophage Lambda NinG protein
MPKSKRTSSLAKAKKDCWTAFSIYIRTRDCIRFGNSLDIGMCVTCGRTKHFKELQAGHFIPGRNNAVLFDERIVYSQCVGCNGNPPMGLGGNYVEYFIFMEQEWGREKIDEFRALKFKTVKYTAIDLLEKKEYFEQKTRQLIEDFDSTKR